MARTISDAVRDVCLAFPGVEEYVSHGSPNFRARGTKTFVTYVVNHHGDGRVALWLNSPDGIQRLRVESEPEHFFVPPYVGPKGWLGVKLDSGLTWKRIAALVREAYENSVPKAIAAKIAKTPVVAPPDAPLPAAEFDPLQTPQGRKALDTARTLWGDWPEVTEKGQFGHRVWRAGKRTFAQAYVLDGKTSIGFKVGTQRQADLLGDPRFRLPPYIGHQGWISLDVSRRLDRDELRALALESYRAVALRRMLARLDGAAAPRKRR